MRGTGIDGLKGMSFNQDDVIRPLLNITRDEIEGYVKDNGIQTVEDHTNLQTVYTRNRIRLELLPYIMENFNPNIIEGLFRMSLLATEDSTIIEDAVEKKYNSVVKNKSYNSIIFSGSHFMMESTPLKKRLIRKAVLGIKGTLHGIEEKHISSVLELFQNKRTGSTLDLPGGIIARVSYDELFIERSRSAREELPEVRITLGDSLIPEWGLLIKVENIEKAETDGRGKFSVTIDGDKLEGEMILRQRRDGDRFSPTGLIGSKKLKDYFIDRKVPRDQRDTIPIISDSKGIVWVAGHSVDKRVAADVKTINHLRLTINKIK
jgi:tRNA(Ile)-lysidine synthase